MIQNLSQNEIRKIIIKDMVEKKNTIVPIIGDDTIIYKENENSTEVPFQEFIVGEFQKKYSHIHIDEDVLSSMKGRGYYGLSLLSQYYNEGGRFLDDFMEIVKNNESHILLREEVYNFLIIFNFPIIITTICFDIIERQLKGQVEDYKSIWYRLNKDNRALQTRCVYHILGQAKDGTQWVYDEDLLLTFLLSHNNDVYGASGLTNFLKENEKKLFVLGCNLPNWLFRFLWQPTQTSRNSSLKTTQGYWIHKDKPEDSFENFLKKKNFSSDEQVKDILIEATKRLQEVLKYDAEQRSSLIETEEQFDVFISYASEDRQIATCIFEKLKNMNVKAWFDDRGEGEIKSGDPYWQKIKKGIKHSTHFMPIITGNWMQKVTNTSNLKVETYLVRDWVEECGKEDSPIKLKANYSIPVIIKDSTYNGVNIDNKYIEQAASMGFLPYTLFNGIRIDTFDENNYTILEKIEW